MTQSPPGDIFTRRVCLQLDGMDAMTVRRDVAYGPPRLNAIIGAYEAFLDRSAALTTSASASC